MSSVVRTQVQFTEAQARELRRRAAERGVSVAALVREAVDHSLAERARTARMERALEVVGVHASTGATNAAEEHDRYLGDAFSG